MASIARTKLITQVNIAANTTSDSQTLPQKATDFVAFLKIENYVAGTYNVTIEHSGNGVDYTALASFAALSANGSEYVQITDSVLSHVRAVVTVAGGDADVTVDLFSDPAK